ncbi:MAG: BACON domain-containing carbohydrate-binding protein [Flectobacillus sp.]|nr:BACON domain-containing carbohydrate-binding protein [Flectobacillus sp.]
MAGDTHSLFLKTDGTVWVTGANSYGQLGDGTTTKRNTPVQVVTGVKAIATGEKHSLFLKIDGSLWVAGSSINGQLGDGTFYSRKLSPEQVATGIDAIAAGATYSLFLKTDGTLWATGDNTYGQLGDGTKTDRSSPVQVATGIKAIAARNYHSMFLKTDGTLWATGSNFSGQLGDGTNTSKSTPIQVATEVKAISTGYSHSLLLKTDGIVWATGYNVYGQLGNGTDTNKNTWIQVFNTKAACTSCSDANFSYTPTNPQANQSITFKDESIGSPTSWAWDFGDGTTSTLQNPSKTYTKAGDYVVKLTISKTGSTAQSISKTISIVAPILSLSATAQNAFATASTGSLTLNTNNTWTASSNVTWLKVSPTSGNSGTNIAISFTIDANTTTSTRSGIISFSAGGLSQTFTITQAGAVVNTLTLSATSQNVVATASTGSLTLNTNNTWTASSNATWLKVSPTSGNAGTNVTIGFTVDANTTTSTRSGIITFSAGTLTQTFTITQAGAVVNTLTLSATSQNVVATSGTGSLTINTNNTWTASSNVKWLKVSPTSGNAGTNVTIGFTVDINPTTATRSGIITFSAGTLTQTFTVTQAALVTAIEENEPSQYTLQLYPNPSKETVTVELKSPKLQKAVITIHNLQGQKIEEMAYKMTQDTEKVLVDVGQLPSGTYIVKAAFEDGQKIAMKLLIER